MRELDEELSLYDPEGPWRFLQARLDSMAAGCLEALTYCSLDEVPKYRERFLLVRHLAALQDELQQKRAELQEQLDVRPDESV